MLLCKGRGCNYRKTCRRYVLGQGVTQYEGCGDRWIDHCIDAKKFEKYVPVKVPYQRGC